MARNEELFNAIMKGKRKDVAALVQAEIDGGANVGSILMESMIPAMRKSAHGFPETKFMFPKC